jgi:ABC-2 type transport system permease protein
MRRLRAIARKEFLHNAYDVRTLSIILLMPVLQLVIYGYALNREIRNVRLAVADYSQTPESRALQEGFAGSPFFVVFPYEGPLSGIETLFKARQAHATLVIPQDFAQRLARQAAPPSPPESGSHPEPLPVQLLYDASDPNAATLIRSYCGEVMGAFDADRTGAGPPLDLRPSILFNPDLKSSHFFVPGVISMILVMISALLTSIAIARERETGTMEQILVSPVRPWEIILGKVLPYIGLSLVDAGLIVGLGLLMFGVPFLGEVSLFAALTLLYIVTALGLGLMISVRAATQQVAMMAALFATVLPTLVLSDMIFPLASMPAALQAVSHAIPARHYLLIARGIMLKGSTADQLAAPILSLAAIGTFMVAVAIRRFRVTLE